MLTRDKNQAGVERREDGEACNPKLYQGVYMGVSSNGGGNPKTHQNDHF